MLREDSVLTLKAFQGLERPVQGYLHPGDDGYYFMGPTVAGESDFRLALKQAKHHVFCLRQARFLPAVAALTSTPPSPGPFVARGVLVQSDRAVSVVMAQVVSGKLPEGAAAAAVEGNYLLAFDEADLLPGCPDVVVFGTVPSSGALAPDWGYVSDVAAKLAATAVVACANGLFVLKHVEAKLRAEALARRGFSADLTAYAEKDGTVIYLLASNCLLVAPPGYERQLRALQVKLGLRPTRAEGIAPAPVLGRFALSNTFLEAESTAEEASLEALGREGLQVFREPLARPPCYVELAVEVQIEAPGGNGLVVPPWKTSTRAGDALNVRVSATGLRVAAAAPASEALRSLVAEALEALAPRSLALQPERDAFSAGLCAALQSKADGSGFFLQATQVSSAVERRPDACVVPAYAAADATPRMAAYLGALALAGVKATFQPWGKATANGAEL